MAGGLVGNREDGREGVRDKVGVFVGMGGIS